MNKIFIPFLLIFTLCSCVSLNSGPAVLDIEYPEAIINGETVTWSEIEYFEEHLESEVKSKFIFEYDAVDDDDFWDTAINGETPRQYLYNLCKEKVLKAKIQLILCRENNIYGDISIESFFDMQQEYNRTFVNNENTDNSRVPVKYYDYYVDNGISELKNILGKTTIAPTEKEIQDEMVSVKEKYSDKSEDEQLLIAKEMIIEEKYESYIEKLCNEAEVDWSSFDKFQNDLYGN